MRAGLWTSTSGARTTTRCAWTSSEGSGARRSRAPGATADSSRGQAGTAKTAAANEYSTPSHNIYRRITTRMRARCLLLCYRRSICCREKNGRVCLVHLAQPPSRPEGEHHLTLQTRMSFRTGRSQSGIHPTNSHVPRSGKRSGAGSTSTS